MPDGGTSPIEIMIDKALRAAASLFGFEQGTGKWMFTDVRQLDALIGEWIKTRDAMDDRIKRIGRARETVKAPAPDLMSAFQAHAFQRSLIALEAQAKAMYQYADTYVQRLQKTRVSYEESEARNTTRIKGPHG